MRDRTKKRLRWFLIAVAALSVGAVAAYVVRDRQLDRAAIAGRDEGLRLLESGDYFNAMHRIGPYVRRHPEDVEALLAYTRARENVREPDRKNITEALVLYRRVLSLAPGHMPAAESLLRLYQTYGLWTEAIQLSADLLAMDPRNKRALEARAMALFSLGRFAKDEALNAAMEYSNAYPGEMAGQLLTLEILQHGEKAHERVMARCDALRNEHPNDPRFILLTGIAHVCTGDQAAGREWLDRACQKEMPDAEALAALVEHCDRLEMFDASLNVLQRHGSRGGDFGLMLTRRLWELERFAELTQQVEVGDAVDGERAALACLALHRMGQKEQAQTRAKSLAARADKDAGARLWSPIITGLIGGERPDDPVVIAAGHKALEEKSDPRIRFLLAGAYLNGGDAETALQMWQQVSRESPGWSAPLANLAQATLSAGRYDDAILLAQAALTRKSDNSAAMLVLARAQIARTSRIDSATADNLLALLDRIDSASDAEGAVAPLRVHVLAATDRKEQAIATARQALAASPPLSAITLIQLAGVCENLRLGMEEECLSRCEQLYGQTCDLAYLRAKKQLDAGAKQQALEQFAQARSAADAPSKAAWDGAWAKLLEMAGDERAREAWIAVADASPDDSLLQWVAISAKSVQDDRQFIGRVLDRLRERMGDQGFSWRLSRARWLLQGQGSQNAVEAALILNDLTRSAPNMLAPRLLLADCLQQLGNTSGAIDQLTAASNLWPQSAAISLQLARLLHQANETARSRLHLDRVLENPMAEQAQLRDAAILLDVQGDPAAGLAALEKAYGKAIDDPPRDLLLARLYLKTNRLDRVETMCMMLAESNDAAELSFVAEFYLQQNRATDITAVLQKLQTANAEPGVKEIIFGSHALRTGDAARALEYLVAATRVAPENPLAWRQLVRLQLVQGEHDAALTTLRAAAAALPDDAPIAAALRQAPAAFKWKQPWPELVVLLSDMLDDPSEEQTLVSAVELLTSSPDGRLTSSTIAKLYALAGSKPRLYALQIAVARACLVNGRTEEASVLARRAAAMNDEALPLAVQTLAIAHRWDEVAQLLRPRLKGSSEWRKEWMRLAGDAVPNRADAAEWLREVEPLVAAGDVTDRLALAECWQALAQKHGEKSFEARASELTRAIAGELNGKPLPVEVAVSLGVLHEGLDDPAAAEACYRQALESTPGHLIAQNNLAMLLARRGHKLEEALELAQRVAAAGTDPNVVSFYDTLAFVRVQRKEYAAAIETLTAALKLKPDHLWCQIRLTDALERSGQMDKARQTLAQLEKDLPRRGALNAEISTRLADLRARLARENS